MKLRFDTPDQTQPDPFIFEDGGTFYLYVTATEGVEAYESDSLEGVWHFRGVVTAFADGREFWAPSVIRLGDKYYMYVSCESAYGKQLMHVASAEAPLGPFANEVCLYDHFSIDSHMVKTEAGLFLWYAKNNVDCDLVGTRVFVDRFLDPYTPERRPKEVLLPSFREELYTTEQPPKGDWYTIEGPFWFQAGEWQYLMYSGGCYQNDSYHIGYAVAKTTEQDLTKVDFVKVTNGGRFAPVIIKNEFEEGTGHHSVIFYRGSYYAIYHGRDIAATTESGYTERRTARICRLDVSDGTIVARQSQTL